MRLWRLGRPPRVHCVPLRGTAVVHQTPTCLGPDGLPSSRLPPSGLRAPLALTRKSPMPNPLVAGSEASFTFTNGLLDGALCFM